MALDDRNQKIALFKTYSPFPARYFAIRTLTELELAAVEGAQENV